jgi:UDP-glucose 4-epimerase
VDYTPARKTDVPRIVLDVSRIREHLGWSPRISMEQGLRRTWDWIVALEEGAR